MPQIINLDVVEKRIYEKHGGKITMSNYKGNSKIANFHCNVCGYDWETTPFCVSFKNGCKKCFESGISERNKLDFDFVKKYIESQNCCLISKEYIGIHEKMKVLFECGHEGEISLECFKKGNRCRICGIKNAGLSKRMPIEKLLEILKERGLVFIEFPDGYKNKNSKIKCLCKNGHIEEHKITTIVRGTVCNACSRINASISRIGNKSLNWKGGKLSLTRFLKNIIRGWKKDSIKNCNYHCMICGEGYKFDDIHHLYSFSSIMTESINELNYQDKVFVSDFTEEELFILTSKVIEKHNEHPLGVCLCRKHHKLFHKYFGIYNNVPQQFEEFKKIIASEQTILN